MSLGPYVKFWKQILTQTYIITESVRGGRIGDYNDYRETNTDIGTS